MNSDQPFIRRTARKSGNWANPHLQFKRFQAERESRKLENRNVDTRIDNKKSSESKNGTYRDDSVFKNENLKNVDSNDGDLKNNDKRTYDSRNGDSRNDGSRNGHKISDHKFSDSRNREPSRNRDHRDDERRNREYRNRDLSHDDRRRSSDYRNIEKKQGDTRKCDYRNLDQEKSVFRKPDSEKEYKRVGVKEGDYFKDYRRDYRAGARSDKYEGRKKLERQSSLCRDESRQPRMGTLRRTVSYDPDRMSDSSGIDWDTSMSVPVGGTVSRPINHPISYSSRDPRLTLGQDYKISLVSGESKKQNVSPTVTTLQPSGLSTGRYPVNKKPETSSTSLADKAYNHETIIQGYRAMCESLNRTMKTYAPRVGRTARTETVSNELVERAAHADGTKGINLIENSNGPRVNEASDRIADVDVSADVTGGNSRVDSQRRISHPPQPTPTLQKPPSSLQLDNQICANPVSESISKKKLEATFKKPEIKYRSTLSTDDPFPFVRQASVKHSNRRSKVCLTKCKKPKLGFNLCVPGRRRTWNSQSANYDATGRRLSPRASRKEPKEVKVPNAAAVNNPDAVIGETGKSSKVFTIAPKNSPSKQTNQERSKNTDTDAAAALLLLREPEKDTTMPQLSREDSNMKCESPVDFPPVLSPQSQDLVTEDRTNIFSETSDKSDFYISANGDHNLISKVGETSENTDDIDIKSVQNDLTNDLLSNTSDLEQKRVSKMKKKRSRHSTQAIGEVKQEECNLESSITRNQCFVKLCKMEDDLELPKLPKSESGRTKCVATFLADDVTRENRDKLEEVNEPVQQRLSKKRSKMKLKAEECPSPTKVRIKSETDRPLNVRFDEISNLLKKHRRKIRSSRSLFSDVLDHRIHDMNDSTLPDLIKEEPPSQSFKMDLAKLKGILSPHRLKNMSEMRLKTAYSANYVDVISSSLKRIDDMKEELKKRLDKSITSRLPLKHEMKLSQKNNKIRPSVIVSLQVKDLDIKRSVKTEETETELKPVSMNEDHLVGEEFGEKRVEDMPECDAEDDYPDGEVDGEEPGVAVDALLASQVVAPSPASVTSQNDGTSPIMMTPTDSSTSFSGPGYGTIVCVSDQCTLPGVLLSMNVSVDSKSNTTKSSQKIDPLTNALESSGLGTLVAQGVRNNSADFHPNRPETLVAGPPVPFGSLCGASFVGMPVMPVPNHNHVNKTRFGSPRFVSPPKCNSNRYPERAPVFSQPDNVRPLCQQITVDLAPRGEGRKSKPRHSSERQNFLDNMGKSYNHVSGPREIITFSDRPIKDTQNPKLQEPNNNSLLVTEVGNTVSKSDDLDSEKQISQRLRDGVAKPRNVAETFPQSDQESPDTKEKNTNCSSDTYAYIPELQWQSEPLDLSVKINAKPPSSEEYFVGFPLKALSNNTPTSGASCVVNTSSASRVHDHLHSTRLMEEHKRLKPIHSELCENVMPALIPGELHTNRGIDRDYIEKHQSYQRRRLLEENRSLMVKGKETVESRLQGVYSPLSQSLVDPSYNPLPQVTYPGYPGYPYILPYIGQMQFYHQPMMMRMPSSKEPRRNEELFSGKSLPGLIPSNMQRQTGKPISGQPRMPMPAPMGKHGQPRHPIPVMMRPPISNMPGQAIMHGQPITSMPHPSPGQPFPHPMPGAIHPVAGLMPGPMGFYPPMPFGGFVPPLMTKPEPGEQRKRKKKPRGTVIDEKAHPLSDLGATSEDSETNHQSVQASLKRRILQNQKAN